MSPPSGAIERSQRNLSTPAACESELRAALNFTSIGYDEFRGFFFKKNFALIEGSRTLARPNPDTCVDFHWSMPWQATWIAKKIPSHVDIRSCFQKKQRKLTPRLSMQPNIPDILTTHGGLGLANTPTLLRAILIMVGLVFSQEVFTQYLHLSSTHRSYVSLFKSSFFPCHFGE